MPFKINKRIVIIDTFSDKKLIEYIIDSLRTKLDWIIPFDLNEPNPEWSRFFDGIPRYYLLSINFKIMQWLKHEPPAEDINQINSKSKANELIDFIDHIQKNSASREDLLHYIILNIHSNLEYIKFINSILPKMEEWKFSASLEFYINDILNNNRMPPSILILNLTAKIIDGLNYIPVVPKDTNVATYNITNITQFYEILERAIKSANDLEEVPLF